MDKQKYEKGDSAGSKGSQFQVHLLVVFLLNALRMRLVNWRLSTEDKRAGKFDDVVLEWSEGTVLLQAKHKENRKRITVDQLMSTTSKNDDFSIAKYFLSYQEIKNKFPSLKKAVICTNASVNERALKFLSSHTECSDSALFCQSDNSLFYTLKDDILSDMKDKIKTYYSQKYKGREIEESVITDENLIDFQQHFQIYFDYPSGNDLENVIEELLDKTKASASEMFSKVMDWYQGEKRTCLTELHVKIMVSEIRRDKHWQSLKQYNVRFPNNDLNLADSNRRYHLITESAYLLQEIRVWQALRGIGKKALYIHLDDSVEDQRQLIEAFGLPYYIFLIIVQSSASEVTQLWDQIEEILNKYAYKKVVLLTSRDNKLVQQIQSSNNCFDVTKEPPTFEDLLEDTRDRLLKSEKILFQRNVINLEELFAPESIRNYIASLGSNVLERLVGGEHIRVGSNVPVLEEEVEHSYIPRKFIRKNDDRREENIFEVKDRLILISDSAGMGKSTTLTKLAVFIKESSPHLWVVRVVLDHYSKFLRDSLRRHKTMIDIMEFLDSQQATRLMNQLDKLVFSLNNKVVLMLDGIDEISPNYTKLVESLLVNSLKTPNIVKIFATTRPHLAEKLESKFQVKSFVLEPLSERDQIDLLTNYWSHNIGHTDREKCEQYATALVLKMFSWTNYNDFAAMPLQVKMVAEIFQESSRNEGVEHWEGCREYLKADRPIPKLPEAINLTRLFKLFIEKKQHAFVDKFNPGGSAGAEQALVEQFEGSIAFHRTLALEVIIDDETICDLFSTYKECGKKSKVNAVKIGIMQENDNNLRFVHRTFAEYFVAECLLIELKCQNHNAKFQKFLIDEILLKTGYLVIRNFFDGLLQNYVNTLPTDSFQSYQSLSYDIDTVYPDHVCLAHDLAETGCSATLRFLLKCLDFKIIKGKETSFEGLKGQFPSKDTLCGPCYLGNRLTMLQLLVKAGGMNIKDWSGATPLHIACARGHLEMVKFLIEQGADINITPKRQLSPLCEASNRGHLAVVKYLVEQGVDVIANIRQADSELYEAISRNHVPIVNYLLDLILEDGGLKRGVDEEYAMIPFAAAYLGRIDILMFLVEGGMDVNRRIRNKKTLIFGAAMGGQVEAAEYLVGQGADINSRDIENNTVLHLVSKNSSLTSIAKYFVKLGTYVNVKNKCGEAALHVAAYAGTRDVAEILIKGHADVNSTDIYRRSVLYFAAFKNHLEIVELLVKHGADINNVVGDTILHSFTKLGKLDVIKCFVKLDVDVNVKDRHGRTALHLAVLQRWVDITKYLIECSNIDVNSKDNDGQTILHLCVSMKVFHRVFRKQMSFHSWTQRLDIVKRLVERGADINLTNNEGQTILYLAMLSVVLHCSIPSCDHCLIVLKFLIEQGAAMDNESSNGDAKERLAEEIREDERYREQNLESILRLPVFGLLDSTLPLNREIGLSPASIYLAPANTQISELDQILRERQNSIYYSKS